MLLEEGLCKVHEVRNNLVVGICPEGRELKTTACLLNLFLSVSFLDGTDTGGIGVVLGAGAVRDNEQLHILIQTRCCPETISLISLNLVECLFKSNTTSLQLNVNQWETVYKDGNIVTVIKVTAILYILVNNLYRVVVDVLLINQSDVLATAVVSLQDLHIVLLNKAGLFYNAVISIGKVLGKEPFPFVFREGITIEFLQLLSKVIHQFVRTVYLQVSVTLLGQLLDKGGFKCCLTLVGIRASLLGFVFRYNSRFGSGNNYVILAHSLASLKVNSLSL